MRIFISMMLALIMLPLSNAYAGSNVCTDDSTVCLNSITQNTYETLQVVNELPGYLYQLAQLATSWLATDDSSATTQMQSDFATLGGLLVQDLNSQNTDPVQLAADLLAQPKSMLTTPSEHPPIVDLVPQINDINYSTLLGRAPVPKAAAIVPYNFVKNAAGMNISHTIPSNTWQGKSRDLKNYSTYYNMVMSVESFNAYVLSNQSSIMQNFTTTQSALISQASSSSWLAEVATEDLGKVLRQLLMFESQTYVLLSQLAQTQKQMLTAQIMTNALLILNGKNNESMLLSKAQNIKPTL